MNVNDMTLLPPEELFEAIRQSLADGYDAEFTVTGNSMWPFLAHGRDRVTLRKVGEASLKRGDIVLLHTEHGYLLHRITRIKKGAVQTTGDHNLYRDGFEPTGSVLGRVVCFTRKGKQVSCNNFLYRLCSWLWQVSFPVRPLLLRVWSLIRRRIS
ncbi:MAG: S24/S26 family peptidase [Oscillospiraceae bacterium]|nr:S24/S26 family peptidase [Oscillospiraceae bacterium]